MKRFFNAVSIGVTAAMLAVVAFVFVANNHLEVQVQQAARHNFSAASMATNIQIQGERMRRYEKEMFIYAATPDKRAKYVKEFDDAHTKLLEQINAAQATQHKGFSDADREKVKAWSGATAFYANEFRKVAAAAEMAAPEQQAGLTTRLNADIGPGKDRFKTVLDGAAAMREEKLASSLSIGDDIKTSTRNIEYALIGMALLVSGCAFVFGAGRAGGNGRTAAPAARSSAFVNRV